MKNTIAIIAAALVLAVLLPCAVAAGGSVASNVSVTVFCYNTTLNLTTDKASYQYTEVANMTVVINNTQNYNNLSEVLVIELYNRTNGNFIKYMATDSAVAPGNGTNTTSYNGSFSGVNTGNYTLRARVIGNFDYPEENLTAHDCSVASPAVLSDVNITVTLLRPNPPGNLIAILNKTPGPNYQDVTLNWTLSNSSDVSGYVIYKTDSWTAGFNYSDPYVLVSNDTTNWTDPTSDGVDQRYYVVRAFNGALTDENTYAVGKYNLKLYTGWNLISLPLLIWNQSMNDVFYTAEEGDTSVRWKGDTRLFQRSDHSATYGWFGQFNTIQVDRGYWYYSFKPGYVTTPYNNTIVGAVPTAARTETIYAKSWSLLGWTSINTKSLNSVLTGATEGDTMVIFNAVTDLFRRADYSSTYGWFGQFSTITHGRGYWYYSNNVTQMTWGYNP
jgi:hypothetical protein